MLLCKFIYSASCKTSLGTEDSIVGKTEKISSKSLHSSRKDRKGTDRINYYLMFLGKVCMYVDIMYIHESRKILSGSGACFFKKINAMQFNST